ncbi:MAG: hypothetical protein RL419_1488 [Actinomycetota bacterium]|jgi:hypothetical protein
MSTLPRILTIMGSGETAPTMVSTHRKLVATLPSPVDAVIVDTPFGFQENAPELASRAIDYFKVSVNIDAKVAGLVRLHDTHVAADPVSVERGLRLVDSATYLFAGPGSPTYALRQWAGSRFADVLRSKMNDGGIVTFASAAALTLGKFTVPVYEIYKVGEDVRLLDGLNVLGDIGVNAVVIPHYDNTEGGNHDTRFCYLGDTRLSLLESMLDQDTFVLGVDEHTAVVIDLDAESCTVAGNGTVTVRHKSTSRVFETGEVFPLDVLRNPTAEHTTGKTSAKTAITGDEQKATADNTATSLGHVTATCTERFNEALDARDPITAVRAALELEQAIHEWSTDSLQSEDADRARAALRAMISNLGDLAVGGARDPRDVVAPFVEALLSLRATVRAEKRFDLSDTIRDAFTDIGVEVRDTPSGVEWQLRD